MTDLRERFARTDDLPAPDLWLDIERKVSTPSKRPPNDTLRRLVTIAAAFAIAIAAGALLLRAFDRGEQVVVPIGPAPSSNEITFAFDHPGLRVYVNDVRADGVVSGTPVVGIGPVARFDPDQPVEVPAGARIVVELPAASDGVEVRGSINACCDSKWEPPRLYELDLTNGASMPVAPGRYVVELSVEWPISEGGGFIYLFPVRVVATEGDVGA